MSECVGTNILVLNVACMWSNGGLMEIKGEFPDEILDDDEEDEDIIVGVEL